MKVIQPIAHVVVLFTLLSIGALVARTACAAPAPPLTITLTPGAAQAGGNIPYVDVEVGDWAVKAMADPDQPISVGDTVALGFSPGRVRLFDPSSEARL